MSTSHSSLRMPLPLKGLPESVKDWVIFESAKRGVSTEAIMKEALSTAAIKAGFSPAEQSGTIPTLISA